MDFLRTLDLYRENPSLVAHFTDAIVGIGSTRNILFWNYGASALFGYQQDETLRLSLLDIADVNFIQLMEDWCFHNAPQSWRGELKFNAKNGSAIHTQVLLTWLPDKAEYILIARNITEQKMLENIVLHLKMELHDHQRKSMDELAFLYEKIDEGFIAFDVNWNYLHINKKAASIVGRAPEDLIGKNVWQEFPRTKSSNIYFRYLQAMETQRHHRMEEYSSYIDKWFEIDLYPTPEGLCTIFHDITERKRTAHLLNERDELYRNIVETAHEGIWTLDNQCRSIFVNHCLTGMLGYSREGMANKPFFDFIHPSSTEQVQQLLAQVSRREIVRNEYCLLHKDKHVLHVEIRASPLIVGGTVTGTLLMVMDITERKHKELEIERSYSALRELNNRLMRIREEERTLIARELHDELGQQLSALKMDIFWLTKNCKDGSDATVKKLQRISEIANDALTIVERKSIELHPAVLNDLGLLAALEWQNEEFKSRFQVVLNFEALGNDSDLKDAIPITLYRVYQESLNNIARHSSAKTISASFIRNHDYVFLHISDDGLGFDLSLLNKRSLGILSMRERVNMVGGEFTITSTPGQGTTVEVKIPLTQFI